MNSTPACEPGRHGLGQQRAVHVGVSARLEHQRPAKMIGVLLAAHSRFSSMVRPRGDGKAVDDQAKRLARRVRVNRAG